MSGISLSQIKVNTKTVEVEFPNIPGFFVKISAISRELSRELKKKAERTFIDPKHRVPVTELDQDKFLDLFARAAVKGWRGLKYKHLPTLLLVDLSSVPNIEDEVEFTLENVCELLKNSAIFDSWINDEVFDIERFRDEQTQGDTGASENLPS